MRRPRRASVLLVGGRALLHFARVHAVDTELPGAVTAIVADTRDLRVEFAELADLSRFVVSQV